jgi:hypothetical protein
MKTEEISYDTERFDRQAPASVSHKEANQKAAQASAITGDLSGETYTQVYNELSLDGKSPTLDSAVEFTQKVDLPEVASYILAQNESEEAAALIKAYADYKPTVGEAVKDSTATNQKYIDLFSQQAKVEEWKTRALRVYQDRLSGQEDSETGVDFLKSWIPFFDATQLQEFSGSAEGLGSLFMGEKKDRLNEEFNKLNPYEQEAYIRDVIKKGEDGGYWLGTPLGQLDTVASTLKGQDRLDYWLSNIGSVADFLALTIVPKAIKAVVKFPGSADNMVEHSSIISTTKQTNPDLSKELATSAIQDGNVAEKLSGTTKEGVYQTTELPRGDLDFKYVSGLSSSLKEHAEALRRSADDIMRTSADTGARTSVEQQFKEVKKLNKQANKISVPYGDSAVKVERVDGEDYMFMSIPIARGDGSGFNSASAALESAVSSGRKFGVIEDEVEILRRDPLTNDYNLLSKEEKELAIANNLPGDYVANIRSYQRYSTKGQALKDAVSNRPVLDKILTVGGKNYSGFVVDAANHFNKFISGALGRATDVTSGTSTKLLRLVEKDFINLGNDSKIKVWDAVNKGNQKGKYFTEQELVKDFGMNQKEVQATYSVYRFWDTLWQMDNRTLARNLNSKGYHIISKDDTVLFGKPEKIKDGKVKYAYDLSSGKMVKVGADNEFVYKLKKPLKVDGQVYKRVVGDLSTHSRLVRETDQVLARRQGYVKRIYDNDYIVDRVIRGSDGSIKSRESVAAGNSVRSAETWISNQKDGAEYQWRRAKELTSEGRFGGGYERSRSVEKFRGEGLQGIERTEPDLADIENPIDSMVQAAITTANGAVLYDTLKTIKGTFLRQYGLQKFPVAENAPELTNLTKNGKDVSGEAKAFYNYISNMENRANSGIVQEVYRDILFNAAELLEGSSKMVKLSGMTADQFRKLAKVDPVQAMKTLPHMLFIASAPIRQLVLQHSQLIQLSVLTKRYANPLNLVKDIHAIRSLVAAADDTKAFDKTIKALAKSTKRSEAEVRSLYKSWKDSGLAESIDSHQFIEANLSLVGKEAYNTAGQAWSNRAKRTFTAIPKYGQKYGFDVGEMNNLIGSFLVAAERKKGKVDLNTTAGRSEIADDARKLSWNFNNAGKMDYQYGALSLPTMYAQVPHKAVLNMIAGSGTLTKEERLRVVAMNFTLFGSTAFGIDSLLDSFDDSLDDTTRSLLQDGLTNIALNSLFDTLSGEEGSSVDYTGMFSPTSGYLEYLVKPVEMVMSGQLSSGGAFFAALGKAGDVMKTSVEILSTPTIEAAGWDDLEKGQALLRNILTVYSGVNHLETAIYQYKLGTLTSLNGTTAGQATSSEIIAKLFGGRTIEESTIWDLMKDERKLRSDMEALVKEKAAIAFKGSARMAAFSTQEEVPYDVHLQVASLADFKASLPQELQPMADKYIRREMNKRLGDNTSIVGNVVSSLVKYRNTGGDPLDLSGIESKLRDINNAQPRSEVQSRMVQDYFEMAKTISGEQ